MTVLPGHNTEPPLQERQQHLIIGSDATLARRMAHDDLTERGMRIDNTSSRRTDVAAMRRNDQSGDLKELSSPVRYYLDTRRYSPPALLVKLFWFT